VPTRRLAPVVQPFALGERRFPTTRIAAVLQVAALEGIAASELLRGTGLDAAAVNDPRTLTSTEQYVQVGRNVLLHRPASDLGLRIGAQLHLSAYGIYGYALLCCETLRHVFDFAVRYRALSGAVWSTRWFECDDRAVWAFPTFDALRLERPELDIDPALFRLLLEIQIMVVAVGVKDVMGPACTPVLARFAGPAPARADSAARMLGCAVQFDQPCHELHFPAAWLERAPTMANPIAAAQMSQSCAQMLHEFERHSGVSRQVVEALTRTPGRFPGMDAIARELCMTSRHLRRKLDAEGTAYQTLLDNVRHALAKDYLNSSYLSTDDIADALGFSDAASFRHAFKRWTGMTPVQFKG
jgi:AraC-like DNA-binding protein